MSRSIVYVATVKHCGTVSKLLEVEGLTVAPYHGRLAARSRHDTQDRFMADALAERVCGDDRFQIAASHIALARRATAIASSLPTTTRTAP